MDAGRRLRRGRLGDDTHAAARRVAELVDLPGPAPDRETIPDGVHPGGEGQRRIAATVDARLSTEGFVAP